MDASRGRMGRRLKAAVLRLRKRKVERAAFNALKAPPVEAHRYMESNEQIGKIVVTV